MNTSFGDFQQWGSELTNTQALVLQERELVGDDLGYNPREV